MFIIDRGRCYKSISANVFCQTQLCLVRTPRPVNTSIKEEGIRICLRLI